MFWFLWDARKLYLFWILTSQLAAEQHSKLSQFLVISKESNNIPLVKVSLKNPKANSTWDVFFGCKYRNVDASLQLFRPHGSLKFFIHSLDWKEGGRANKTFLAADYGNIHCFYLHNVWFIKKPDHRSNVILRIARNFLETRENIKILTHPFYHIHLDWFSWEWTKKSIFFWKDTI